MVARYSNGARYDTELMARLFAEADGLRDDALGLAEAAEAAFGVVSDAHRRRAAAAPRHRYRAGRRGQRWYMRSLGTAIRPHYPDGTR